MKEYNLRRNILQIACFTLCLGLLKCTYVGRNPHISTTSKSLFPDGHNSANSVDWVGTYKGTMPCSTCEGIETEITLTIDQDYTYKSVYLRKSGKGREYTGTFVWDARGSIITLLGINDEPNKYFIGENRILQLDPLGNKREGVLADMYFLIKQPMVTVPDSTKLVGNWELNYIANSALDFHALYPSQKPTINFDTLNNAISGNTSCNLFAGKMSVTGDKIDFTRPLAMTKRMCLDGKENGENVFIETLKKVNTYTIGKDSTLNFIMGDIALMRFSKIPPPQYKP
jgi:heat shock protein HslJ